MIKSESTQQLRLPSIDAATVEIAPNSAKVCGVVGCTRTEQLLQVTNGGETRILCPEHVVGWLE